MSKDEIIALAEKHGAYVGYGVSFHRHEFDAFAAALAQQATGEPWKMTGDEIHAIVSAHGTGGWQTVRDMHQFAKAIIAARDAQWRVSQEVVRAVEGGV